MDAVRSIRRLISIVMLIALCSTLSIAQQRAGGLRGQVTDEQGALIVGATVTLTDAAQAVKTVKSGDDGSFVFTGLVAGKYKLNVKAAGFLRFELSDIEIVSDHREVVNVKLNATIQDTEVSVATDGKISTDPEESASAIILKEADLAALPDDPDELAATLQAMAGPSSGFNGGQFYSDGFRVMRMPPKRMIREVRINQNPFSAEYDRLGFSRIDIFTKPGTEQFHGQAFFNFNDESLNSRNPFAANRAAYQSRFYGANLGGPLLANKASFFFNFERSEKNDNAVVNATTLDQALNITPVGFAVVTPQRRTSFDLRLDYMLNQASTLVARYSNSRINLFDQGIGDLSLPSRSFDSTVRDQTLQLTLTNLLSKRVVNETRFQFARERLGQQAHDSAPTISVLDAFVGGGAQVGISSSTATNWELQNYTIWTVGKQTLKGGIRLRDVQVDDLSQQNFSGVFTFTGGMAVKLDERNRIVREAGSPVFVPITSLDRYRRTLLFQRIGLPSDLAGLSLSDLGYGPNQLSIAAGQPAVKLNQLDIGAFIQDDWRVAPNFTLSFGLRYENQNNVSSNFNLAPRLRFAWSPWSGKNQKPKTVLRGGVGIFYDRVDEALTLQAKRFNGVNQQQFIVTDPAILQDFPNVPSAAALEAFAAPQSLRQLADDIRTPYTMQTALGVDRELPYKLQLSVTFLAARSLHVLRSRNINAPFDGPADGSSATPADRPNASLGNIYQFESSGVFNQRQLIFKLANQPSRRLNFVALYILNKANSDTDGVLTFPANQYDLSAEYGRSALDIRHTFTLVAGVSAPWELRFSPFITATSGRPFNIITGTDANGDSLFNDRPAFATDLSKPGVVITRYGAFDPNPAAGQPIIPRNYGSGPAFFTVNMRVSRTFAFGGEASAAGVGGAGSSPFQDERHGSDRGTVVAPFTSRRYNLTISIQAQNLFNRVNGATPIGNLSSPLFGRSIASAGSSSFGGVNPAAGNRRIELQLGFSF